MQSILLLEDDDDIRAAVSEVLEMEGYDVVSVTNGAEGISRLAAGFVPGAIILDYLMPVVNGPQFLEKRKEIEHAKTVPVLMLSATNEAPPLGIEFVRKPIDIDVLIEAVSRLLKQAPLPTP